MWIVVVHVGSTAGRFGFLTKERLDPSGIRGADQVGVSRRGGFRRELPGTS
jgi:hypothetical protein